MEHDHSVGSVPFSAVKEFIWWQVLRKGRVSKALGMYSVIP